MTAERHDGSEYSVNKSDGGGKRSPNASACIALANETSILPEARQNEWRHPFIYIYLRRYRSQQRLYVITTICRYMCIEYEFPWTAHSLAYDFFSFSLIHFFSFFVVSIMENLKGFSHLTTIIWFIEENKNKRRYEKCFTPRSLQFNWPNRLLAHLNTHIRQFNSIDRFIFWLFKEKCVCRRFLFANGDDLLWIAHILLRISCIYTPMTSLAVKRLHKIIRRTEVNIWFSWESVCCHVEKNNAMCLTRHKTRIK